MSSTRNTAPDTVHCSAVNDPSVLRQQSTDLLQGGRRMVIEHRGETYCLRITRNERLILTKL